mmetsp:Transcript_18694/g.45850  ORF Transcript_18694/g.45850 Transcript_18694/m.45850 type:complete len:693 (+) Transcript_18694:280-2358(+)
MNNYRHHKLQLLLGPIIVVVTSAPESLYPNSPHSPRRQLHTYSSSKHPKRLVSLLDSETTVKQQRLHHVPRNIRGGFVASDVHQQDELLPPLVDSHRQSHIAPDTLAPAGDARGSEYNHELLGRQEPTAAELELEAAALDALSANSESSVIDVRHKHDSRNDNGNDGGQSSTATFLEQNKPQVARTRVVPEDSAEWRRKRRRETITRRKETREMKNLMETGDLDGVKKILDGTLRRGFSGLGGLNRAARRHARVTELEKKLAESLENKDYAAALKIQRQLRLLQTPNTHFPLNSAMVQPQSTKREVQIETPTPAQTSQNQSKVKIAERPTLRASVSQMSTNTKRNSFLPPSYGRQTYITDYCSVVEDRRNVTDTRSLHSPPDSYPKHKEGDDLKHVRDQPKKHEQEMYNINLENPSRDDLELKSLLEGDRELAPFYNVLVKNRVGLDILSNMLVEDLKDIIPEIGVRFRIMNKVKERLAEQDKVPWKCRICLTANNIESNGLCSLCGSQRKNSYFKGGVTSQKRIRDFLTRSGLEMYVPRFIREGVEMEYLEQMSDEDLVRLVPIVGHRARLKAEIAARVSQNARAVFKSVLQVLMMSSFGIQQSQVRELESIKQRFKILPEDARQAMNELEITEEEYQRKLQRGSSRIAGGPVCVVCRDKHADHVVLDCMHNILCKECADIVRDQRSVSVI